MMTENYKNQDKDLKNGNDTDFDCYVSVTENDVKHIFAVDKYDEYYDDNDNDHDDRITYGFSVTLAHA